MAEIKKTDAAAKPVATIKTPVAAEVKEPEVKAAPVKAEEKKAPAKKAAAKKPAAKKAAPAKKAEPKKAAEKTEAKKPAAKKATTTKKAETKKAAPVKKAAPAKKATAAKKAVATTEVKTNIVLQYGDRNVTYDTIVTNAKNNYQYEMGGDVDAMKKLSVYVKPEENAAYYVVDDKVQGRIDL